MSTEHYYCPEHKFNPSPNSGFLFCPQCEAPEDMTIQQTIQQIKERHHSDVGRGRFDIADCLQHSQQLLNALEIAVKSLEQTRAIGCGEMQVANDDTEGMDHVYRDSEKALAQIEAALAKPPPM